MGEVASIVLVAIMIPALGGGITLIIKVIRDNATNRADNTMLKEEIGRIHSVVQDIRADVANISRRLDIFMRDENRALEQTLSENTKALQAIAAKL